MPDMFCFQCQQTAGNKGCVRVGVCGKQPETANLQDDLIYGLIRLALAAEQSGKRTHTASRLLIDGLFTTLTNVNFDNESIRRFTERVVTEEKELGGYDGDLVELWKGDTDTVSLRSTLLFGLKGMAAYAHHSMNLGFEDTEVTDWFYKGLSEINREHTVEEWLALIMEFGQINLKCMALLDTANTSTYGTPVPTRVNVDIKKGPFIVVSGHDLRDLYQLLEQTKDKGINIYTHSEMLPAHGYPELKKYPHLAGNFGTAWQSQQKEFQDIPAPVLFTTNCLMPPRPSYADRVYTTSVVGYEGMTHITGDEHGNKDFTPLIEHALALGGYEHDRSMSGINGGHMLTTGFAHGSVLANAEKVINAIKTGAIKHIFLVGGCDGAHPGRNYYTEFVKQTPMDTLVLTLACGKYRFNDLDLGEIGGLPRILDMGQCNDAYSAIKVALALADAFGCTVNELPLTLVLSWYEQKAVCILLTLLSLGVKNMYLGPTIPAFLSETVVKVLVDTYGLQPITAPEQDMDAILNRG
ncbi:hydroxylamine reductase [[Clostridium] methylpentosum DSM 5476]|uniref:Hydroxylamine reductase n=1 Tax=[Clostridium] methylpentosum DSM 5476 TaxID=537013 RepID=C0EAC9_9FIRM|nr:hydroxylamine reductase [[Clostridium] methylpentosum DSM 5476]MDY3989215.1 hydroxylamine reductase [Massilioclostridium sp.]MEE1492599.1 hydroxylamine reductase [Massilioclostridium sp.]